MDMVDNFFTCLENAVLIRVDMGIDLTVHEIHGSDKLGDGCRGEGYQDYQICMASEIL